MTRVYIADDISKLPADKASITDLHFFLQLSRFATEEPPDVIYELPNLRRLQLEAYGIERIPDRIAELKELRELVIGAPWSGHVRKMSPKIGALSKLEVLEFDSEDLSTMPESILDLRNLRVLKWDAWNLKKVPDLSKLPKLETLWLDVYTSGVPTFIRDMKGLRELRLLNAKDHIPDWLWSMKNLEALGLDYVDEKAELHFERMPQLERVWLRRSTRPLPAGIASLPKLRSLEVKDEVVPQIPPELLRKGSPLEVLRIVESKLKELPKEIANCTKMRALSVGNNLLKSVPEEIATLTRLEELELYENTIPALPKKLGDLRALRVLDAHKNKIESIPDGIGSCALLEKVDLSANRIAALPKSFFTLKKLRSLSLASNFLPKVPAELASFVELETLLLQNNPCTKGSKNKAADAILEGLARARAAGGVKSASASPAIALRARLQTADLDGARELVKGKDGAAKLVSLLDDADAKVRARALGVLGELLPDPFAKSIAGWSVVVLGTTKGLKKSEIDEHLAKAGATSKPAKGKGRIVVVAEKPGAPTLAKDDVLAALPQLEQWMVAAAKPHLMEPDAAGETSANLGELLRSPANENVALGLELARQGGIPSALLPLVLAIARAHSDAKIRKAASVAFERYAPAPLKLAVQNALGRVTLTEGRDEKADKAYAALSKVKGFDVEELALEVARLSRVGIGWLFARGAGTRERALKACVRDGLLAFYGRERMEELPPEIGTLGDSVRAFTMRYTSIGEFPPSFSRLRELETIELGTNSIREWPKVFAELPKLRTVRLAVHYVDRPGMLDAIGAMTQLETLDLEYVRLPMPDAVGKLTNLRTLAWRDYDKMALSPALSKLKKLETLDIGAPKVKAIPEEVVPLLPRLKKLVIQLPPAVVKKTKAEFPNLVIEGP